MLTASGLEQLFQQLGEQCHGKGLPRQSPFWQLGQSWHWNHYCGSLLSKVSPCRVNLPATRSAGFQTSLQGSDLIWGSRGTPVALTSAELIHTSFLSAHPAPPAVATAQVLVKARWEQWAVATDNVSETYLPTINPEEWEGSIEGSADEVLGKKTFHTQLQS